MVCTQLYRYLLVGSALSSGERLRTAQKGCFLLEEWLSNAQARGSCEATAGHMLLGEDVAFPEFEIDVKLKPLLRRYSWKKVPQIYIANFLRGGRPQNALFSYRRPAREEPDGECADPCGTTRT